MDVPCTRTQTTDQGLGRTQCPAVHQINLPQLYGHPFSLLRKYNQVSVAVNRQNNVTGTMPGTRP